MKIFYFLLVSMYVWLLLLKLKHLNVSRCVSTEEIFTPPPPKAHWGHHRKTPSGGFDWQLPVSQWETPKLLIGRVSTTNRPSYLTKFTFFHQLFHIILWHTTRGRCLLVLHCQLSRMDLCWKLRASSSSRTKGFTRRWTHSGAASDACLVLIPFHPQGRIM